MSSLGALGDLGTHQTDVRFTLESRHVGYTAGVSTSEFNGSLRSRLAWSHSRPAFVGVCEGPFVAAGEHHSSDVTGN